jgi:hypothetical protein
MRKIYSYISIVQNTDYQIVTLNEGGRSFEKLDYQLTVIKDQFPVISARISR